MERIRAAVLLPVRIDVKDVYDDTCTELRVTAALDSGGRGRPRVTYDVTAALANMGTPTPPSCLCWSSQGARILPEGATLCGCLVWRRYLPALGLSTG